MIKPCQTSSEVEISNIVFRGVEVKKSEIRIKSENFHHCMLVLDQNKPTRSTVNQWAPDINTGIFQLIYSSYP